jgi:alkylation response protein AidB-like acyl-CoA dehydrogenase
MNNELVGSKLRELLTGHQPSITPPSLFRGQQFDLGLAWVHFPVGYGGLGVSRDMQLEVNLAIEASGGELAWNINPIGYGMAAPTIMAHGSEEHRRRLLRPLFTGEEIWCQLFSEPAAGSDVAGLATRALKDGDEWIINGQKVWSSLAHLARWGLLLARSDPDQPKHSGLTYFILDMHSPGVEVRALRQMTGDAEFNEVFFTDVRVPDALRLGEPGKGWPIAITTLMNERLAIGSKEVPRNGGPIADALCAWQSCDQKTALQRARLMELWVDAEVLRLTTLRAGADTDSPGPENSIGKLIGAELKQRIYTFCLELRGAVGMLDEGDSPADRSSYQMNRQLSAGKAFLRSRASSIEGGTSEIVRNVLAERTLGLPSEPRIDKDPPWSTVPR